METMKLAELNRSSPLAASAAKVRRQQGAADAVAHRVDRGAARDLARHVAGLERAEVHVILDVDVIHRGIRIFP